MFDQMQFHQNMKDMKGKRSDQGYKLYHITPSHIGDGGVAPLHFLRILKDTRENLPGQQLAIRQWQGNNHKYE